jgi:hypothetical protein
VSDLGAICTVALLGERHGRPELVGWKAESAGIAEALAAAATSGALERVGLSAFDASFGLLDVLGQTLAVPNSRWRVGFWGEWDEHPTATGGSVGLGGEHAWDDLAWITQKPHGVEVQIWGDRMGAPAIHIALGTLDAFAGRATEVVAAMRRAIDGRATFRARPFSVGRVGERIERALRDAEALDGPLRFDRREDFPRQWPSGTVWRIDHLGEHLVVDLHENEHGVGASVGLWAKVLDSDAALDAALPEIVAAAREARTWLTLDTLEPGATYELVSDITQDRHVWPAGTRLRFDRSEYIFREGFSIHHFRVEADGTELMLHEADHEDLALVRTLSTWLRRCEPSAG